MKELKLNSVVTMSSLEIAKLTGKEHRNVLEDIRKVLKEVEIEPAEFSAGYKAGNGQVQPCFNLPRRECDLIIAGYSAKYRLAIIDRWRELENQQPKLPTTYIEALTALLESEKAKEAALLEAKNLKIELDKSKEWFSIKKVAAFNGMPWREIKWQPLKIHGVENGLAPYKIFDANFPAGVNVYHVDSWHEVYPELTLPFEIL